MPDSNITYTPNLILSKLPANYHVWAQIMNDNLTLIDAAVSGFVIYDNFRGAWRNSTHYHVGDTVVDLTTAAVWTAAVDHISAMLPTTFAQDQAAHPTYWVPTNVAAVKRGAWMPHTSYNVNDFVLANGTLYAMCTLQHVSGAVFEDDLALGYWTVLIDFSDFTASVAVGSTPPAVPINNQMWWNSDLGQLFVWYNDGDTTQWVPASPSTSDATVAISTTAPISPVSGQMWWHTTLGELFIWYNDGNSAQWVPATPSSGGSDYVTVRDYGAIGDGTADDTAAFVAAGASGRTVYVPAGTYSVPEGNITVASNTEFIGLGMQKAKIVISTTTLNGLFNLGANSNIAIRNLHLKGNQETQRSVSSGSCAINGNGCTDVTIEDCLIEDWTFFGIQFNDVTRASICRNVVRRVYMRVGISCGNSIPSTDVQIKDNFVSETQEGNIVSLGSGWVVTGNFCDTTNWGDHTGTSDNVTAYARAGSISNCIVANNVCKNSGNNGMHVGSDKLIISNNIIINPVGTGIAVSHAPNDVWPPGSGPPNIYPDQMFGAVITGNDISFASSSNAGGIILRDVSNFVVSGNNIRNGSTGIALRGYTSAETIPVVKWCSNGTVVGNTIEGYTSSGIEFTGNVKDVSVDCNNLEGGVGAVQDFWHNFTSATPENVYVGANNYSTGPGIKLPRVVASAGGNSALLRVNVDSLNEPATAPTGLIVHDIGVSNAWPTTTVGAGIHFSSADAGAGAQAGVRLSFGQGMNSASGNNSSFVWSTAPVTAGTMVPVATLDTYGQFNLTSTIASPQGLAKFHIGGDIDRASWGQTVGVLANVAPSIARDTTSAGGATVAARFASAFGIPTFAASNATVTLTAAGTLFIAGSPVAGSGVSITNTYSLYANGRSFIANQTTAVSTTTNAPLRIPHGVAPTTPTDGDIWTTSAGIFVRINGVTKTFTLT